MTQDHTTSDEKRQEVLQRLRNRRGEARRANVAQNKADDQDDPFMRTFMRLRELQVDVVRGVDVSQQGSELGGDEKRAETFLELRQAKRAKRRAAQESETLLERDTTLAAELGEDDKMIDAFQRIQKARRDRRRRPRTRTRQDEQAGLGRQRRTLEPESVSSTDFVGNMQQLLGSAEIALSSMPLEELEQRRKDLKYRYSWMQSLLEEMREELDRLQEHIINRLLSPTQAQTENGHPPESPNQ